MPIGVYPDTNVIVNMFFSKMEINALNNEFEKINSQNLKHATIKKKIKKLKYNNTESEKFFKLCEKNEFKPYFSNLTVAELSNVLQKFYTFSELGETLSKKSIINLQNNSSESVTNTINILQRRYNFSRINDEKFMREETFLDARKIIEETWGYFIDNHEITRRYKRAGVDDILHIFAATSKQCRYLVTFDKGLSKINHRQFNKIKLINLYNHDYDEENKEYRPIDHS